VDALFFGVATAVFLTIPYLAVLELERDPATSFPDCRDNPARRLKSW